MRADSGALRALDAKLGLPSGNFDCDVALFPLCCGGRPYAVNRHSRNGQRIALVAHHDSRYALYKVRSLVCNSLREAALRSYLRGHFHLVEVRNRGVDSLEVLFHNRLALLHVGLFSIRLNFCDGLFARQYAGDCEVASLHDCVDAAAHAGFLCNLVGVDYIELQFFGNDFFLNVAV